MSVLPIYGCAAYKISNGDGSAPSWRFKRRGLPEVNLLIRLLLSVSADMQLEGKPVAEHVL